MGNKKYQLNPEGYLLQGIIPLDLVHSFNKTPGTLLVLILNTSSKYENIPKGSLLGTFCMIPVPVIVLCLSTIFVRNINSSELHFQSVALRSQYSDHALEAVTLH